jgi:hypothetical protein
MIFRTTRAGHRAGCMIALALALSASPTSAQQAIPGQLPTDLPQRPTGAVFGGYRQPQRDILALTTETYGGYDQELQGPPGGSGFGAVRTGAFAGLDAALNYSPTQSTSRPSSFRLTVTPTCPHLTGCRAAPLFRDVAVSCTRRISIFRSSRSSPCQA